MRPLLGGLHVLGQVSPKRVRLMGISTHNQSILVCLIYFPIVAAVGYENRDWISDPDLKWWRHFVALIFSVLFVTHAFCWACYYGCTSARNSFAREIRAERARQRILKNEADAHQFIGSGSSKRPDSMVWKVFSERRVAAAMEAASREDHGGMSPRTAAQLCYHKRVKTPYNRISDFKRMPKTGTKQAWLAWQATPEEHESHRLIVNGMQAALV